MTAKIIIKKIYTQADTIINLSFDSQDKYFVASTLSGRVLLYRYDGSTLLSRLHSFNKYESTQSVTFFENNIACGSTDGNIFVLNILSTSQKILLNNSNSNINCLTFLDSNTLVSGDAQGNIYFNSLSDNKLLSKIETCFLKVNSILNLPNSDFLFVTGDDKYIALYNTKTYKLIQQQYIKCENTINYIKLLDNFTLLVLLNNNTIQKIHLQNPNILKKYILNNDLSQAFLLAQSDPMLKVTKEYKVLEIAYEKVYNRALTALIDGNKNHALRLMQIFSTLSFKKNHVHLLFKSFENYPRFQTLFREKKYALAYAMSTTFPPLCKTLQYQRMEELWEEAFKNAQNQIVNSHINNAIALLNPYATVLQKRPFIKLIINHNSEFIAVLKAIESKNYQAIEEIAQNNKIFTLVPTYKEVKKNLTKLLDTIQNNIHQGKLVLAVEQITQVHKIKSIQDTVQQQIKECKALKKLQDSYDNNNFLECYQIIDTYYLLYKTQLYGLLQKHWSKIISQCESFALQGNIEAIKETLGSLIMLDTRREKIGDILRLSLQIRIKIKIQKDKNYQQAETLIYTYIDTFGSDTEILFIMKVYEKKSLLKLAIMPTMNQKRNHWINSDFFKIS